MDRQIKEPCIMVIFGGTGDLTHRKLIPALYHLEADGFLPENFVVIGVGRREFTHEQYRQLLLSSVQKFSRKKIDEPVWASISNRIFYLKLDFTGSLGYSELNLYLARLDLTYNTLGNRLYYLSVSPEYFETITLNIKAHFMAENNGSWQRLIVEKPFGRNIQTAKYLNDVITDVFSEKNVYRIDHYLGKEMIQNLMVLRFGNALFENMWNSKYIESVQITSSETEGVGTRGGYYDKSGALKDMIQNHILQLVSLVAMEPPIDLTTEAIRDEKVKLLRTLSPMTLECVKENVIRGQFGPGILNTQEVPGYRMESGVSLDSCTETYVAMRLFIRNYRWGNTPFYIRTGKRLPEKVTQIVIEFKSVQDILFFKTNRDMMPNLLIITVHPREGITFRFNTKKPGSGLEIESVPMDFCQNCHFEANSPEAYERLISDAMRNDQTLFTRWDEIEASWRFTDSITAAWELEKPDFPNYSAGTWGPDGEWQKNIRPPFLIKTT